MSGPDRIITLIDSIPQPWRRIIVVLMDERDKAKADLQNPAVLAALPEVQAMIAGAYEAAASCTEWTAWGQRHNLTEASRRAIRAMTPADAIAARDAMIAEAASWQPVATAPRNTLVDIWVQAKQKGEGGRYTNYQLLDSGHWFGARTLYPTDKVTHWMHIPESPRR